MEQFRTYGRKLTHNEMRPYTPGESLDGISISDEDIEAGYHEREGSFISRNPDNHADQWFVNADYFAKYFNAEPLD